MKLATFGILIPLALAGPATLNDENFQDFIDTNDRVLVEFYAPWCGHCKSLAPEWEKAADKINDNDSIPAKLAAVDATEATGVAGQFDIKGYPTIKWFEFGKPTDYNGPRQEDGIVNWIVSHSTPAVEMIKSKEAADFGADTHYVVIGRIKKGSKKEAIFAKSCNKLRSAFEALAPLDVKCGQVTLKKGKGKFVVRRNKFNEDTDGPVELAYDGKVGKLKNFVMENMWPLMGPRGVNMQALLEDTEGGLFIYDDEDADLSGLVPLAKSLVADSVRVGFLGEQEKEMHQVANKPTYLYMAKKEGGSERMPYDKYLLDASEDDSTSIEDFVTQAKAGSWPRHYKTQDPPEEAEDENGIMELVGSTFDDVVNDPETDTLVEFYAPWCGHCKNFVPQYEKFSRYVKRYYRKNGNVQIAKINAADNEVDAPVSGFPTILFYPGGGKKVVKFEGQRDERDELIDFIEDNAYTLGKDEL